MGQPATSTSPGIGGGRASDHEDEQAATGEDMGKPRDETTSESSAGEGTWADPNIEAGTTADPDAYVMALNVTVKSSLMSQDGDLIPGIHREKGQEVWMSTDQVFLRVVTVENCEHRPTSSVQGRSSRLRKLMSECGDGYSA